MRNFLLLGLLAPVFADLYMHNPRGSNDRLNEANTNRDNGNRLFDSQNNDKGGYCWGESLTYYEGSELTIEWTMQHACLTGNNECNLVLQYMCGSSSDDISVAVRDGTATDTIDATTYMMATAGVPTYGMHESYAYWNFCQQTSRNMGLFTADQNLNNDATSTRQNNNANQHGFECAEERDYYPYWRPTPWIDIAVLTSNTDLCSDYEAQSQNSASTYHCTDVTGLLPSGFPQTNGQTGPAPLNEAQCTGNGGTWTEVKANGHDFDCDWAPWTRDNHLGNSIDGFAPHYNWTLPSSGDATSLPCLSDSSCQCVLRLRYNISTHDVDNWLEPDADGMPVVSGSNLFIDWQYNGAASPLQTDPTVDVGGFNVTLALDTAQYGRTFQDRSYVFGIQTTSALVGYVSGSILNLNVRGKRGNIVQAYPATEYDFVPTWTVVPQGAWIHFQWTGCDNNPAGNAGEGTDGTDRTNLVQMREGFLNFPDTLAQFDKESDQLPFSSDERLTFAAAGQTIANCPTYAALLAANNNNANTVEQATNNCFKLNAAPRHFDGGAYQFNKLGAVYNFLCTRNNNFSNRSHKGGIYVTTSIPAWGVGITVGCAAALGIGAALGITFYLSKVNPYSLSGKCWTKIKEWKH